MVLIDNVTFSYQGRERDGTENINLKVAPGELILLCGRSGCGKTTVTRLVNGLIPHFYSGILAGKVTTAGLDIAQTPLYEIARQVGSVFQNPRSQFFNMDTDSEIAFGMENFSYPVPELLARMQMTVSDLHLDKLLGRSIFELSGGEKQRIAFATAYATSPAVYVLDEPSSNLDHEALELLQSSLLFLKQQGKTILVAEHRLHYLKGLIDRIVYLDQGKISGIFTLQQFAQISQHDRKSMGLRTMDLHSVSLPASRCYAEKPVLELRDVSISCTKTPILKNISLTASRGEIIGVTGSNGIGKSTFLRTLCGLIEAPSGSFLCEGRTICAKERLTRSYMVMQDVGYQLFGESVERECVMGIRKPDYTLVTEVLEKLGLLEFRDAHPNTLSGGQKQRLAVAVAMICNKDILIFDEPTSGLDFDSMMQVSVLLHSLSQQGRVIFVATHDYEFLCTACTRAIHFNNGLLQDDIEVNAQNIGILRRCLL